MNTERKSQPIKWILMIVKEINGGLQWVRSSVPPRNWKESRHIDRKENATVGK